MKNAASSVFFLFCCICLLGFQITTAQTNNIQVSVPPAPEAAAFGKFGDIPVGEFTGSAQVSVPVYTISHRGVSIPLGLSYHSNGIRVTEEAGWTGLGWTLSTGGMVTRAIRGHDDFGYTLAGYGCTGGNQTYTNYWTHAQGSGPQGFSPYGEYLDFHSYLQFVPHRYSYDSNTGNLTNYPYVFGGQEFPWSYFCQSDENVIDLESDLYTYNILGYSGKFIIGNNREIVFLEATDLEVEVIVATGDHEDVRWVFTTPQGIKVYVGTDRSARQMTYTRSRSSTETNGVSTAPDFFNLPCNRPAATHISTWYVDRIEAPSGEEFLYTYQFATEPLQHPVPGFSSTQKDKVAVDESGGTPDGPNRVYSKTVTSIAYDNIYLDSIHVPAISETIFFSIDESREDLQGGISLDKIIVERSNQQFKVFDFSYDYFSSPATNLDERWEDDFYGTTDAPTRLTDNDGNPVIEFDISGTEYYVFTDDLISKRLRLTSVQELGNDLSADIPPFTFAYYDGLPVKTSYAVDQWGHYNGQHNNRTFIPKIIEGDDEAVLVNCAYQSVNDGVDDGADRQAYFPYTQAGLLHTVTYPTGGRSELTYEAHQFGVTGEVSGNSYAEIFYQKDNDCLNVPIPANVPFVFEDNNPTFDVHVLVNIEWQIVECGSLCLDCLEIVDDTLTYNPLNAFRYTIKDGSGAIIHSWEATEVRNPVTILPNSGLSLFSGFNQFYIDDLVGGQTYYLNIERISGGPLSPNLLQARMTLEWVTYDDVEYVLAGNGSDTLRVTNSGFCTAVPLPTPVQFVVDDNNPETNPCVNVELRWQIEDCASETFNGCTSTNCYDIDRGDNVEYDPLVTFRYVIDDANGNEVVSWNWNNGSGGITGPPSGETIYNSVAYFQLANLVEGATYTMRIEGFGGTDLAYNLISADMIVSWGEYVAKPLREGAGVRIASTVAKTETGQEAQSRYYIYEDENGVPSGRAYDSPITYYVSTEGRIHTRQVQAGVAVTNTSSTAYLNRLSNSLNALSNSYAGSHVTYDKIKVEHGSGGSNGYVTKRFQESEPVILELDFKMANLPYFYNQRTGSVLEENIYNAQGVRVKQTTYDYNDDWGGNGSSLLGDPRFALQWGYRVVSPRHFTYSQSGEGQNNFSIPCSEGFFGPQVFAYTDVPQWHYLEARTEKTFGDNGSFTESTTEYDYENVHFNLIEEKITGTGIEWTTKYRYAEELGSCILAENMTGIPLEVEAPNGVTYLTEYDCTYLVPYRFKETYEDESFIIRSEVTAFDGKGYPLAIDRFGYDTEETYIWQPSPAPDGLLKSKTYLNWTEEFSYNQFRLLQKTTAIDDQPIEYVYDVHSRLQQIKARPGGANGHHIISTTTYEMGGPNIITNETVYSDAPTQTAENYFDGLGRPTKIQINGVVKNETVYDDLGRVAASTYLPGSFTTHEYDNSPLNRPKQEIYPDGNDVLFVYSAEDNEWITTRINERGFPTKSYTDILGRESKMEDAIGGITDYSYDNYGRLTSIAGPAGAYAYVYDTRNRLISKSVPGALASTYCYDDDTDLLCASRDGVGNRLNMLYDAYQRKTEVYLQKNAPLDNNNCTCSTSGERIILNEYDLGGAIYTGKLSSMTAKMIGATGEVVTDYTLDAFGRVAMQIEEVSIDNNSLRSAIDPTLNHADWILTNAHEVSSPQGFGGAYTNVYAYDDFGRVIQHSAHGLTTSMRYNDQDQMMFKIYDDGLQRQNYKYNSRGWLTNINTLRPEVLREKDRENGEACELPTGEDESYVINDQIPPSEFFALLCDDENISIPVMDSCGVVTPPEEECLQPLKNYTLSWSAEDNSKEAQKACSQYDDDALDFGFLPFRIDGIHALVGNNISLVPLNYPYSYDCAADSTEEQRLVNDLSNWLLTIDTLSYPFDSVYIDRVGRCGFNLRVKGSSFVSLFYADISATGGCCKPGTLCYQPGLESGYLGEASFSVQRYFTKEFNRYEACLVSNDTTMNPPTTYAGAAQFPVVLYEVILANGEKDWLYDQELTALQGGYTISKQLRLPAANAQLEVVDHNDSLYLVDVAGFEALRGSQAGLFEVRLVEDASTEGGKEEGKTVCPPVAPGCSEAAAQQQRESLADLCDRTIALFNNGTISYPFGISFIQLCDGSYTYVLTDLISIISGGYNVLDEIIIEDENELIDVQIREEEAHFSMAFTHQPNGNIEQMKWKISNRATSVYDLTYDPIDRVVNADFSEEYYWEEIQNQGTSNEYISRRFVREQNERYSTGYTYDGGGNILSIWRNGLGTACLGPEGRIDDMTLTYGGEGGQQLLTVADAAAANLRPYGFKPHDSAGHGSLEYTYDENGNMTYDPHKELDVIYNFLNLPEEADGPNSSLKTVYDATGRKWKKENTIEVNGTDQTTTTLYADGMEFEENDAHPLRLASINGHEDGRSVQVYDQAVGGDIATRAEYYHKDHLGNVRLSFSDLNQDGALTVRSIYDPTNEILFEKNYYPFGLELTGPWFATVAPDNKYRYNGKELDEATGHYFYGFRMYDPAFCRFTGVDPIADKFAHLSVYNYASNDPVSKIDLHGLQGVKSVVPYVDKRGRQKEKILVEATIYVGISSSGASGHYTQADVESISASLHKEYNRGGNFFKVDGKPVEFSFNVQSFDVDAISPEEKARDLIKQAITTDSDKLDSQGNVIGKRRSITGVTMTLDGSISNEGETSINDIRISPNATNPDHTQSHELGHFLLLGSQLNPRTEDDHNAAGGIFQYEQLNPGGQVTQGVDNLSRQNVINILDNIPNKKI